MYYQDYQSRLNSAKFDLYNEALVELKKIVKPEFAHDLGILIAWGYREDDEVANSIVKRLDIGPKHLAALLDDQEWLEQEIDKNNINTYLTAHEDA